MNQIIRLAKGSCCFSRGLGQNWEALKGMGEEKRKPGEDIGLVGRFEKGWGESGCV